MRGFWLKTISLIEEDCKNELSRLKLTTNKSTNRKLVNFEVFLDSAHQSELEKYQDPIYLDDKYLFHGAPGQLTINS